MKILILANNDVGLYKFRKELIIRLIEMGHQIIISLPDGKWVPSLEKLGCKFINTSVDRRGMNPFIDMKLFCCYHKIIKNILPDIVITYTIKPNIYGGLAARQRKIPYYINITGLGTAFQKENLIKKAVICFYKIACKKAKILFFENKKDCQGFLSEKIVSKEHTYVLNGAGVNIKDYSFTEYPKQEKTIRFLFIGRIMKEKGIDELLAAFSKLKKEENVILDVVGPIEDIKYRKEIQRLVALEEIQYYGFQEDVKSYIKKCHCVVLPSYHEGMANVLLEAGSMGRPLIASQICGCKEAINGKNGMTVKCKDVEDLYNKMKKFVMLPYKKKQRMGMESHKYISERFSKEKVIRDTIQKIFVKGI